ncbi:hypothetical protein T06_15388 [Trichinella sp. T6]|nr:hypothetical protein T06_15388 [Trichinella sp. T6]
MRSERPTTGTESYELVEQADALQRYATVTIVIGSHSQDCLHISFVQLLKEISSFAVWNDWRKLPPRQMVFKFESSSGEEHLHLPTATMAVSTVNYMQYDSSPDVWNFDDQEKELSDVQLMAAVFIFDLK